MDRRAFLGGAMAAVPLSLLSKKVFAQDVSRKQILIGQSADLSGTMQNIGQDYFTGAKLAFDQANAAGGISGRRLRLTQLDDGGDPARAAANARRLIEEDKADLLFGFTGEACVEAVTRCAAFKASDIELFAPLTGIEHAAGKDRLLYLRPAGAAEMVAIVERLERMNLSRTAILHSSSPAMIQMRSEALAHLKGHSTLAYPLKDGAENANAIAEAIQRSGVQAVAIMADSISAALLVRRLRERQPALFICLGSMVDVLAVQELVGFQLARGLMVSRVVPDPQNVTLPVVSDYRRMLRKYLDQPPTPAGLEGYIAGLALIDVLRRAETPRQLVSAAQRKGSVDLGGWRLDLARARTSSKVELALLTADGKLL